MEGSDFTSPCSLFMGVEQARMLSALILGDIMDQVSVRKIPEAQWKMLGEVGRNFERRFNMAYMTNDSIDLEESVKVYEATVMKTLLSVRYGE